MWSSGGMRHTHIWRKSVLVRGNGKCQSPRVGVPGVFEEDQVGQCSWHEGGKRCVGRGTVGRSFRIL